MRRHGLGVLQRAAGFQICGDAVAQKVRQPILARWAARVLLDGNPMLAAKGRRSSPAGRFFGVTTRHSC
jgi:hypothetical protein